MERLGDILFEMRVELILWVPWAAVSLLVMAWFAFGRHLSWETAPRRESSMNWAAPLLAILLMFAGGAIVNRIAAGLPSPTSMSPITMEGIAMVILQIGAMGIPAAMFAIWACIDPPPGGAKSNGLVPRRPGHELLTGVIAFLLVTPAVMGVNSLVVFIGALMGHDRPLVGHDLLALMRSAQSWMELAPMLLSAVLLAPLFEELIFRGVIQTPMVQHSFLRRYRWIVILASATLFTAVHGTIIWQVVPGLFLLGITLAWLYERTGSLMPCFVVHLLFNLVNVILALTLVDPSQSV
jgi:membrane protease YdiL (CAAX protease family)